MPVAILEFRLGEKCIIGDKLGQGNSESSSGQ